MVHMRRHIAAAALLLAALTACQQAPVAPIDTTVQTGGDIGQEGLNPEVPVARTVEPTPTQEPTMPPKVRTTEEVAADAEREAKEAKVTAAEADARARAAEAAALEAKAKADAAQATAERAESKADQANKPAEPAVQPTPYVKFGVDKDGKPVETASEEELEEARKR